MPLNTSGAISIEDVWTEHEAGTLLAVSLAELYAGGAHIETPCYGTGGAIPTSSTVSLSDYYGSAMPPSYKNDYGGNSTGSSPRSLSISASTGDLVVCLCGLSQQYSPNTPTGFTSLHGTSRQRLAYKVATGSMSSIAWTFDAGTATACMAAVVFTEGLYDTYATIFYSSGTSADLAHPSKTGIDRNSRTLTFKHQWDTSGGENMTTAPTNYTGVINTRNTTGGEIRGCYRTNARDSGTESPGAIGGTVAHNRGYTLGVKPT